MGKATRKVDETFEICDWCEAEIRPIYDTKMMSLWPLVNPDVRNGGFLNEVKYLLANFGRQIREEPSYMLHAECAQKMISWAMAQKILGGPEKLEQYGAKASPKQRKDRT